MPTLFRLTAVVGILFALGYGVLFATTTFLRPVQRPIVEVVELPQAAELHTGRSAAETLNSQAAALLHRRKPGAH